MTQFIALEQDSETKSIRDLGEFTVKSGAIRFTDPCYDNDTWCKGSMPALNGQWQAQIGFFRDSYDARRLFNHINQIKYVLSCYQNFNDQEEKELWGSFGRVVSKARDHTNGWQKISRLYELIEAETDESKKTAFKKFADEAVAFFDPLYTSQKEQYWEKDLWLLFELASAFQSQHQYMGFDDTMFSLGLIKLRAKVEGGEISQEEINKQIEEAKARSIKTIEVKLAECQEAYDSGSPRRTQFLRIKHESVPEFTPFDQELWIDHVGFDVGVDSGQAGFFDEGWYQNEYGGDRDDNDRSAYFKLCALSSGGDSYRNADNPTKEEGGTFEFGCNSYTAHGDGSAPLYYRTNEKGEVIEAVYHYDVAYDEDEEGGETA